MKKTLLSVSIDDYNLKLLQAQSTQKGWLVEKVFVEPVSGKSDDDISASIKELLHKDKFKKANTTLVVPRSLVTVRYLQLPTSNPAELDSMVDMQVVRQIPYSKEEMIYDYYVTGATAEGYTKVLLIIVHKDVVLRYIRILSKAGITPDFVELDSFAVVELCRFLGSFEQNLFEGENPIVILDTDYAVTNILIIKDGMPVFTRSISIGRMHIDNKTLPPSGKDWISEWAIEVNRSLNVFQKDYELPIKKIVVFEGNEGTLLPAINGRIGFQFEKCNISKYIEGGNLSGADSALPNGTVASFAALLGAVKEGSSTVVNLIPSETKAHILSVNRRKTLTVTAILAIGVLVMLGATFNKKIQDRKKYLVSLDAKLRETNPAAKELSVKKDRLALIKKQLSVEGTSLDLLRELYDIIPQKTALTLFMYDDSQGVTIKGVSPAMSEVFELVPKLENSSYFEKVTTRSATQRKIKGQELTDFQIDCTITVPENK